MEREASDQREGVREEEEWEGVREGELGEEGAGVAVGEVGRVANGVGVDEVETLPDVRRGVKREKNLATEVAGAEAETEMAGGSLRATGEVGPGGSAELEGVEGVAAAAWLVCRFLNMAERRRGEVEGEGMDSEWVEEVVNAGAGRVSC